MENNLTEINFLSSCNVSILVDHLQANSEGWQVWEKAELICARPANGRLVLHIGGRVANEEQGRPGSILASSCRSTAWFFLILLDGSTSNKDLSEGRFLFRYKNSL
jgi:hypothetical protein